MSTWASEEDCLFVFFRVVGLFLLNSLKNNENRKNIALCSWGILSRWSSKSWFARSMASQRASWTGRRRSSSRCSLWTSRAGQLSSRTSGVRSSRPESDILRNTTAKKSVTIHLPYLLIIDHAGIYQRFSTCVLLPQWGCSWIRY